MIHAARENPRPTEEHDEVYGWFAGGNFEAALMSYRA
jgi:hypothetical protein